MMPPFDEVTVLNMQWKVEIGPTTEEAIRRLHLIPGAKDALVTEFVNAASEIAIRHLTRPTELCKECGAPFFANNKGKVYCSTKCGSKARTRKYKQKVNEDGN